MKILRYITIGIVVLSAVPILGFSVVNVFAKYSATAYRIDGSIFILISAIYYGFICYLLRQSIIKTQLLTRLGVVAFVLSILPIISGGVIIYLLVKQV